MFKANRKSAEAVRRETAAVLEIITKRALSASPFPTNKQLAKDSGVERVECRLLELVMRGDIRFTTIPGAKARQAVVLTGSGAGHATAEVAVLPSKERENNKGSTGLTRELPNRFMVERRAVKTKVSDADFVRPSHPVCAWCEKPHANVTKATSNADCCCRECAINYATLGNHNASKSQIDARLNRPPGPKGCATVEEWISKGGTIYRETRAGAQA